MAEVTLEGTYRPGGILYDLPPIISVKRYWSDQWTMIPFLFCNDLTEMVSSQSGISTANLIWDYGMLVPQGYYNSMPFTPLNIAGCYVKIEYIYNTIPYTLFIGTIESETITPNGPFILINGLNMPAGKQSFRAFGFEHLLDRKTVDCSYTYINNKQYSGPIRIKNSIVFNKEYLNMKWGNRTKDKYTLPNSNKETYLFSDYAAIKQNVYYKWSNHDILEYLLLAHFNYNNDTQSMNNFNFTLYGEVDILKNIYEEHNFDGKSLKQCINELVPKSRGLGWRVYIDSDNNVGIYIFSIFIKQLTLVDPETDQLINYPQNPIVYDIFSDNINSELTIEMDKATQYDEIVVQGKNILTINSFYFDGSSRNTFVKNWSNKLEQLYKDSSTLIMGDPDDIYPEYINKLGNNIYRSNRVSTQTKDAVRKDNLFEDVYQSFVVDPMWDFKTDTGFVCSPRLDDYGNVIKIKDEIQSSYNSFSSDRRFQKQLPVTLNIYDPDTSSYVMNNIKTNLYEKIHSRLREDNTSIMDGTIYTQSINKVYQHYEPIDRVNIKPKEYTPSRVAVQDEQLGIKIKNSALPHVVSGDPFFQYKFKYLLEDNTSSKFWSDSTDRNSGIKMECDYHDFIFTGGYYIDERVGITIKFPGSTQKEVKSIKQIKTDDQMILIDPDTVIDCNFANLLNGYPNGIRYWRDFSDITNCIDGIWWRDDRKKLINKAILAANWYSMQKGTIKLKTKSIELNFIPGAIVRSIVDSAGITEIGTIITQRQYDFVNMETTIMTGYVELEQ